MFGAWKRPKLRRAFRRWFSSLSPTTAPSSPTKLPSSSPQFRSTIIWYAYIISAATVIDAGVKRRRRNHWDRVIAEAEESLNLAPEQLSALRNCIVSQNLDPKNGNGTSNELQNVVQTSAPASAPSAIRSIWGSNVKPLNKLFQVRNRGESASHLHIIKPPSLRAFSNKSSSFPRPDEPLATWSPKKLVRSEYSIAKLAARLVSHSQRYKLDAEGQERLNNVIAEASARLESTKHVQPYMVQDLPRMQHPRFDLMQTADNTHQKALCTKLQYAIMGCLSLHRYGWRGMVRRIALILMTSTTSPQTECYTLLISYLSRFRLNRVTDMVIQAMLESSILHDQLSVCAILTHYVHSRSPRRFHHIVGRLDGERNRLQWSIWTQPVAAAESKRNRVCNTNSYPKIPLNNRLGLAIVHGYLSFDAEDLAIQWLHKCQKEGVDLDLHFSNVFLMYYYRKQDWEAVESVWNQIHSMIVQNDTALLVSPQNERLAYTYALRSYQDQGKQEKAQALWNEARSRGWLPADLLYLPRYSQKNNLSFIGFERRKRAVHDLETQVLNLYNWVQNLASSIEAIASRLTRQYGAPLPSNLHSYSIARQQWSETSLQITALAMFNREPKESDKRKFEFEFPDLEETNDTLCEPYIASAHYNHIEPGVRTSKPAAPPSEETERHPVSYGLKMT